MKLVLIIEPEIMGRRDVVYAFSDRIPLEISDPLLAVRAIQGANFDVVVIAEGKTNDAMYAPLLALMKFVSPKTDFITFPNRHPVIFPVDQR